MKSRYTPYGMCRCGCGGLTRIPRRTDPWKGQVKGEPNKFLLHHRAKLDPSVCEWDVDLGCYRVIISHEDYALVDAEDIDKVSSSRWHVNQFGHSRYAGRSVPSGEASLMHRLITEAPVDMVVDHISGDGLDNRRCNLRLCTRAENNRNRTRPQSSNTSGYQGVYWRKGRGKWMAQVKLDKKITVVGSTFLCPIEAAIARDVAAMELHGRFASLNFPELRDLFGDRL